MNRDAQSLTRNNQAKSCKLPVSRTHKIGSQGAHTIQTKLLKNSATPIIITGDSTAAGLRRYGHVWLNYFRDALNSVSMVIALKTSYGERGIFLFHAQLHLRLYTAAQIIWKNINQKILQLQS